MYPSQTMTPPSSPGLHRESEVNRHPIPCPFCGRALPVWAESTAVASGVWVKCKNPACKREINIKL